MLYRSPHLATLIAITIGVLFVSTGCDSTSPEEEDFSHIEEVRISPDSVSMSVGETADFSFTLLTADGDTVDADLNTRWESTDTSVFTVTGTGLATARAGGKAHCVIEASSYSLSDATTARAGKADVLTPLDALGFVGRDSAIVMIF